MRRLIRCGLVSAILCSILIACGGGGGGGGASSPYTGISTPATLTSQNAQEIVLAAYEGGAIGSGSLVPLSANRAISTTTVSASIPQKLSGLLHDATENIFTAKLSGPRSLTAVPRAPFTETGTEPDLYGIGSISYSLTIDDVTWTFSGSFTFNNYHFSPDEYLNGTFSVSGKSDPNTGISSFSMSSNMMIGVMEGQAFSFLSFSYSESVVSYYPFESNSSMTYYLRNDATGDVYWVNNYNINAIETSSTTVEMIISGTFYHPDYGNVTFSTIVPLQYSIFDYAPSAGSVLFVGANNTKAIMTCLNNTRYRIEVDADGNGVYENTAEYYW